MSWDHQDFLECTRYGCLYVIKQILNKGNIIRVKRIRKNKNKLYEENNLVELYPNFQREKIPDPEIGDFVYCCSADKSFSLLKKRTAK